MRSYYTIEASDVGRPLLRAFGRTWCVADFIGRVLPRDVGKRVYLSGGLLQVESDAQRDRRLASGSQLVARRGTSRALTGDDYAATCSELIRVFARALEVVADPGADGTREHLEANDAAFAAARTCGWDFEHDEAFIDWMLRATGIEVLVGGLLRALAFARKQYLDRVGCREVTS